MNPIGELEAALSRYSFAWLGFLALNGYGLARHVSLDLLVLREYGLDDAWAASELGAEVLSLERETGTRIRGVGMGLRPLFEGTFGERVSSALLSGERPRVVVSPRGVTGLEALASRSDGRVRVAAAPAHFMDLLNDKMALRRALPELGIEPLPHVIQPLSAANFAEIRERFGLPFVVQLAGSSGGAGTFFVSAEEELASLRDRLGRQDVILSKYVSGLAPNINAVVLDDDVLVSYPSMQVVGAPECVGWPSGYCGNDFTATQRLPEVALSAIYDQTRKIGTWVGKQGFRGMWGIDFVVEGSRVYPLEVNPRFQGSTRLLTELEYLSGQAPLVLAHVLGFLEGGQDLLRRVRADLGGLKPLQGAQLDVRCREDEWSVVNGSLQAGVYRWADGQGIYLRPGMTIADCASRDEFVLTGTVPRRGTRLEPAAHLLRIQTPRSVLEGDSTRLQPWASSLTSWVYESLDVS